MRPEVAAMLKASCRTLRSFKVICSRPLLRSRVPKPKIFCRSSVSGASSADSSEDSSVDSPGQKSYRKGPTEYGDEFLAYTFLKWAEFLFLFLFLPLLFRLSFGLLSFSLSPLWHTNRFRRRLPFVFMGEHPGPDLLLATSQ